MRRKEIVRALKCSGNSAPGLDGIPYAAWRCLKELGISVLLGVALALEEEDATDVLTAAYSDEGELGSHDYNAGTLECLPKAHTGEDPDLGHYFKPGDTRPLSIVNCDNRLVASAMRMRWEVHADKYVGERQQGFLKGRSILRNLVDVENAMMLRSVQDLDSVAVFLDFAAAFPSVSQEFIMECLQHMVVPRSIVEAFRCIYDQNKCRIAIKGELHAGFGMTSGVRQGCPLSPLVYALVAEVLMDRLEDEVEGL